MKKIKATLKKLFRFFLKFVLCFFAISIVSVIIFRWVPIPFTPLMLSRLAEQKINGKDFKLKKDWEPLEDISLHLQRAVVGSEDQLFLEHWGFDVKAIEKAMNNNKKKKRRIKGASTISQQTAKNLFLWQSRNWIRKGLEVYFTGLIELFWSKERILEVYLNIIEMGDGIYGAEAASQAYFKKTSKNLTPFQAALIAAILPNPHKYSAVNPSGYIQGRQKWVLRQMNNIGPLNFEKEEEKKKPKRKKRV